MRWLACVTGCGVAFAGLVVAPAAPVAAPSPAIADLPRFHRAGLPTGSTVRCPRLSPVVKIEFGIWGGAGTSVEREWFALVGSRGADRPGGHAVLGAVTPTRSEVERACRTTRAAGPGNARGLGKRFAYRPAGAYVFFRADDGERILGEQLHRRSIDVVAARRSHGAAFTCLVGRGVVVRTRRTSSSPAPGWTLEVREGDELLAVASLRANAGWFRVATRCALD